MEVETTVDKNHTSQENKLAKKSKCEDVDYDDLLSAAGEFGLYQILLFVSTFPFYWFGVFTYFGQLFMTEVSPNHWCWIPELENLTDIDRRSLAIPVDDKARFGYSQCRSYVANWTEVLTTGHKPDQTWTTQPCQDGWEFNKTEIPYPTISSEMGWVCERDSYQATAQSIFFVGSIIGGFLVGWIADRFGRLPGAVFSNIIGCVAGIASTFVNDFLQFAICRFFVGMAYDNCLMMTYLLVVEYVAPKYRTIIANMPFAIFFTSGLCALPWISLACGHWKVISLVTSVPMALSLLAPFIIPESPRWLLSKGRIDDAVKKVLTIGQINKKEISPKLVEHFIQTTSNSNKDNKGNVWDLIKRPLLRTMFICICLNYMCCMIVFDALVRSIGSLQFDFFLSFTVLSLTEFPSLMIVAFILDWTGRKWLTLITFSISCIFSILTVFVKSGLPSVLCAVVARFSVNMACNTAMQWAAEMLPTPARGSGVSIVHIFGYIGTVISPFIVYLEVYVYWLPLVIVGCTAALGALVSLRLPETANIDMPQSFDDAEEMIRIQKILELPCIRQKKQVSGHVNDSFEMYD